MKQLHELEDASLVEPEVLHTVYVNFVAQYETDSRDDRALMEFVVLVAGIEQQTSRFYDYRTAHCSQQ
ncbi:hypothetical protein PR003_g21525 [Phytophthora rubi]|uniref:Uncharacterized protein n=1 Tax=Phytophthora rubi TaxID=129364 RepID=A0A6A4DBD4_9STRA|nr:hypothetical protein PR003_g21525 [Phytophthora rubi]